MIKAERHVTPMGVFEYPRLSSPDQKYNKYQVNLLMPSDSPEAIKLMDLINKAEEDNFKDCIQAAKLAKRKPPAQEKVPYEMVFDYETGEETGMVRFKFNMLASGTRQDTGKPWKQRPVIYDAKRAVIPPEKIQIWGGTEGRVSFLLKPYDTPKIGVKLCLLAVQVIKLVSNSQSAEALGFEEEEGYTLTETEGYEEETSTTAADTEAPDDNEDF